MTTGLVRNGLLFDADDGRWIGALDANGKEQLLPAVPGISAGRPRIAVLGASITNRNSYGGSGGNTVSSQIGFLQWAQAILGMPFDVVSNAGIGGQTMSAVAARLKSDVLAYSPDVVILGGDGIGNSVNSGVSAATIYGQWAACVEAILDAGKIPIVCTCPPNDKLSTAWDTTGAWTAEYHKINDMVKAACRADSRLILFPWDEIHADQTAASSRPNTTSATSQQTTAWTNDGTHPHPRMAIAMGTVLAGILAGIFPARTLPFPNVNSHPYSALSNAVRNGSSGTLSGGASGSAAAGDTLNGNATVGAKVARAGFSSNDEWQRVTTTNGTGSATYNFGMNAGIPGDKAAGVTPVFAAAEIMLLATPTNLRGFKLTLGFSGTGLSATGFNTAATGSSLNLADAGPYIPQNKVLLLHTPIAAIPANATALTLSLEATKGGGGNLTADFYVGRAGVFAAPIVPFNNSGGIELP